MCLWADPFALLVLIKDLQVAGMVIQLRLGVFVPDVIRAVVVHAIEIIAALYQLHFLGCPLRQSVTKLLTHGVGVFAEVDWVAKPANGELNLAVAGLAVLGIFGIPGFGPVTYTK